MEIRTAYKEDFSELLSFYNRMCSVLGEQDFLPEGDKGGFPSEEMIREEREQILTAGQSDIRALSKVLRAMLDAEQICVIGSEEKIEECREMFGEVRTLS